MKTIIVASVVIGAGATLCMDFWLLFLRRAFAIQSLDYCLLGRWILYMPSGRFLHDDIRAAPARARECLAGWVAHYAIGISCAGLFLSLSPGWLERPALLSALAFGGVTTLFPLFVMQPAIGLGVASSKTAAPTRARLKSFATHLVYGAGLYIVASLGRPLLPWWV